VELPLALRGGRGLGLEQRVGLRYLGEALLQELGPRRRLLVLGVDGGQALGLDPRLAQLLVLGGHDALPMRLLLEPAPLHLLDAGGEMRLDLLVRHLAGLHLPLERGDPGLPLLDQAGFELLDAGLELEPALLPLRVASVAPQLVLYLLDGGLDPGRDRLLLLGLEAGHQHLLALLLEPLLQLGDAPLRVRGRRRGGGRRGLRLGRLNRLLLRRHVDRHCLRQCLHLRRHHIRDSRRGLGVARGRPRDLLLLHGHGRLRRLLRGRRAAHARQRRKRKLGRLRLGLRQERGQWRDLWIAFLGKFFSHGCSLAAL
jgi:hypothetical protein